MEKLNPIKSLGQNFLHDKNILRKIVEEINPQKNEKIIEIGPGMGALTEFLFPLSPDLTVIEYDKRAVEFLKEKYSKLNIIQSDFLKINLQEFYINNKKLRLVGNIPYNITSPIIFKLFENNKIIKDAVFMVQYEVAKRMTSSIGTKDYGILSVLLQFFTKTKFCFKVSPNVFYPKPKVASAVIHLNFKNENEITVSPELFIKIVKAAFGNRRKTLKNSLANSIFAGVSFENSGIDFSLRAEQLLLEDFIKLTETVKNQMQEMDIVKKDF